MMRTINLININLFAKWLWIKAKKKYYTARINHLDRKLFRLDQREKSIREQLRQMGGFR